jgi:L-malate glycosyltransferase
MHVLHIDEQRGWRGGEQQANWLIQGLLEKGITISLAGRPDSEFLNAAYENSAINRFALPFFGEPDLISAWRLAGRIREHDIDLLHAHTSLAHTMAVLARRFAGRGKVIVSRRVSFPPHTDPVNRWKYSRPDRILAVSEHVAGVLRNTGIPEALIGVVHSAVDPGRLETDPVPRSAFAVPENAPLIVNAGALVGHKDQDNLLRAIPFVRDVFPDVQVIIAGEGGLRGALAARIDELDLRSCVRLIGHRKDAPAIIRMADRYVSSSWSEGLGTSILEALACGTPVVATDAGGAREMVLPGETGYLAPVRDPEALAGAVISSLRNPEKAREMAENAKAFIHREFVTARMVEKTLGVYNEVLRS